VKNPSGVSRGVSSLTVDGQPIAGNLIPAGKLKKGSRIVAELG